MTTVIINKFDGGHAEDLRTFALNQCEKSLNFDIFTNPHLLKPYPDLTAETVLSGTLSDHKISDVIDEVTTNGGSDGYIALGQAGSGDGNLKFFSKADVGGEWTKRAERSSGNVLRNTLIGYKRFAFALEQSGSDINLLELTNVSTITDRGTITGESSACKPFVHPEDNLLYIGTGDQIARYDGTNDIDSATGSSVIMTSLMPTGTIITSLTDWGTYLAIACRNNNKNAYVYLWGRDSTLNTFQGIVDFGKGDINVLENLGNVLVAIITPTSSTSIDNCIQVKVWSGGEVITIKEIEVNFSGSANQIFKAKARGKLFFTIGNSDCIYVVGKNKSGEWVVTKDRYVDGGTVPLGMNGLSVIDDYIWIGYIITGSVNVLARTSSGIFSDTSVFKTTINPSMSVGDRYKNKQLMSVRLSYTGASSGTTVLKYSIDGSTMTTLISDTNATGEKTTIATAENTDALPLLSGREFQFQIECTGGTKIKEIEYVYQVLNEI